MSGPSRRRSNPAKGELSDEQINSIHEAFVVFDMEKTGKIASKDLKVFSLMLLSLSFLI